MNGRVNKAQDHEEPCETDNDSVDQAEMQDDQTADIEQDRQLELVVEAVGEQSRLEWIGTAVHGDVGHPDLAPGDARYAFEAEPEDQAERQEGLRGHGEDQQLVEKGHCSSSGKDSG